MTSPVSRSHADL